MKGRLNRPYPARVMPAQEQQSQGQRIKFLRPCARHPLARPTMLALHQPEECPTYAIDFTPKLHFSWQSQWRIICNFSLDTLHVQIHLIEMEGNVRRVSCLAFFNSCVFEFF